jgi:poly(ADP-ribose) glycohydrolase ARH3
MSIGHPSDPGLADRWRGTLLGTALGDAVGAPFEGRRRVDPDEVETWLAADDQLVWTDDTAMTIGLARSLEACDGEVEAQHLGDTFAEAFRAEPWRGYGAGPPRIFAAAARGTPYLDAASALFDGRGSFGNGAAMRAAPAAVVGGADLGRVAAVARAQARVTHAHPLGQDGAALLALAVATVATGDGADPAAGIAGALDHLETPDLREAARTALALGPSATPATIAGRLGNGIAALEAVPAALAAFLGAPDDPRTVLVRAVTVGGDTDTIAAMAGALVGARVGARGLPAALLERLEARDELVDLADTLSARGRPGVGRR